MFFSCLFKQAEKSHANLYKIHGFFLLFSMELRSIFHAFFTLIYPQTCCACRGVLVSGEKHLCGFCRVAMPGTGFYRQAENPLVRRFWGRVQLETGTALYYFQKGGRVQQAIHQFKYRGNLKLGVYLGRLLGLSIKKSPHYKDLHMMIPVPLHPEKARTRGFNQSEIICRGMSEVLQIPGRPDLLTRLEDTGTQTKKDRFRRWENVSKVFQVTDKTALKNQHVLLVDDVITTGATLEACAQRLLEVPGVKVWIAALAITD